MWNHVREVGEDESGVRHKQLSAVDFYLKPNGVSVGITVVRCFVGSSVSRDHYQCVVKHAAAVGLTLDDAHAREAPTY